MSKKRMVLIFLTTVVLTVLIIALLISIFERRQEARLRFFKVTEIPQDEVNPDVWGENFPRQYERYMRTLQTSEFMEYSKYGRYGGSEAFSKLDRHPAYRRLFAGYSFSVDYREEQGHLKALEDMLATERLGVMKPGTCMTCKSAEVPFIMEEIGIDKFYATPVPELMEKFNPKHAIVCSDCHNPDNMNLRITRPAFKEAMERRGVDLTQASRQEMRTYVCAQCHVEYYFKKDGDYLAFPWDYGVRIDQIEAYYDEINFVDWVHEETKAPMLKMQHPEFEMWSTGIHARSGVACADCHMPYRREGALKITDHWIHTPLANISAACQTCHRLDEQELRERVFEIQDRTYALMKRTEEAILSAQDAIQAAMKRGATDAELQEARRLHRRASMRWDFISAENSMGFHSPQEAARILGDAIDFARQAQISAIKAMGDIQLSFSYRPWGSRQQ